ncbi:MAG: sporulation protein YqfD [Clostridia bacterium]|nr:sporulation protein YqfD [Clostridia bacterium]
MFIKLADYIKGYVSIKISGLFPERFINLCAKNKIPLNNIKRKTKNEITADLSVSNFKKLRKITKTTGCKVHITQKYGLRFFMHRFKKRKAFVLGIAAFFIILWSLTKFVWIIDITGNENVEDNSILEYAKNGGLKTGMLTALVDSQKIKSYIMTNMEELSYVSVTKYGTTVYIDVREREEKREHFDKYTFSNIVADQSGVVESVLVQSGTAAVKKGDVVYKGQLLVSGATDNKYLGIKYSNSDAVIKARVWHEKTVNIPYYTEEKVPTGNTKAKRKLKILNFSLNLFTKNKILFEKYDILSYTNYISLGKGKVLPIGVETTRYEEYKTKRTKLSLEQTKDLLLKELDNQYKDSEIISHTFEIKDNKLTVTYECIEDIGREEEIDDNGKTSGS